MKVRLYAGDMNLNRKDEREKVCRNAKFLFFRKQNSENFFSGPANISMVYRGFLKSFKFLH